MVLMYLFFFFLPSAFVVAAPGTAERGPPKTALEVRGGGAGESRLREESPEQVRVFE